MKCKIIALLFIFFSSSLTGMSIEQNFLNKGRDAIFLHIHPDLYVPLIKRLENHTMVHAVTEDPTAQPFGSVVTIFLKEGLEAKPSIRDRRSFAEILRKYPDSPLSKNAQRKLKNILHAFMQLSEYRQEDHLRGNAEVGFYPMDDWKRCFIPDLVDYFVGMEEDIFCCMKITRLKK